MITRIEIDGFKTFSHFQMEFAPLTVIAGTNASGKSNLFDAMHLLSQIVEIDLKTAFGDEQKRRGSALEQFTRYADGSSADVMSFAVELLVSKTVSDKFGSQEQLKYTRLRYEIKIGQVVNERGMQDLIVLSESLNPLRHNDDKWVSIYIASKQLNEWRPKVETGKRGVPYIDTDESRMVINLRQDGKGGIKKEFPLNRITQAIIGVVNSVDFPHALAAKEEIKSWHFLQLNPESLRRSSSYLSNDQLTSTGENLAAVMHRLYSKNPHLLKEITRRLNSLLPGIVNVSVLDDKVGKQFVVSIKTSDGREFTSRVLSEGTLRLLTLCIFLYDPDYNGLLCFEEPENGVHPARMKLTAEILMDLATHFDESGETGQRQVIINTHSPTLVGDLFFIKHPNVRRIWLSQMVTQITTIKDKKQRLQITKMLPVVDDVQLAINGFTDEEKKLTLSNVMSYLKTTDFEQELQKHSFV